MIKGKNFETLTTDRLIRYRLVPLFTSQASEQSSSRLAFHRTSIYYIFKAIQALIITYVE